MTIEKMSTTEESPYFRYMNDVWYFGILLISGKVMAIECIEEVHKDYIGVRMMDSEQVQSIKNFHPNLSIFGAPTSRKYALVRKEQIVSIFELMDT